MKAVISKNDLVSIIGKLQSIIANKPAIPILSNILIEAKVDQVEAAKKEVKEAKKNGEPIKLL